MSQIAANFIPVVRATKSADSSLASDYNEMLYDALVEGHVMHRRRSAAVWNCPRKAIRTVDSMGRIEDNLKPESKSLKSAMENTTSKKYKRKMKNRVKRHNRISELAKPKMLPTNDRKARNDSGRNNSEHPVAKKSCGVQRNKKLQLRLSGAPKIADNSINNQGRNIVSGETSVPIKETFVKTYKPSERTKKLAEPRTREETEIRTPGKVAESALFATASRRLVELAAPKSKLLREEKDHGMEKKNAFLVSREALRATCSPRIADLSIPKTRKVLERGKITVGK